MLVTIITLVFLAASIALAVRELRRHDAAGTVAHGAAGAHSATRHDAAAMPMRRSGIAWGIFFCALQAFIAAWSAIGLVQQDVLSAVIVNLVLTACAGASFARPRVSGALLRLVAPEGPFPHPAIALVICLAIAGAAATLALELPSNHDLTWMYPLCLLLEFSLITAVMAGLFLLSQRHAVAPGIFGCAMFILGVAEHFVITFKSMPIQPGDLSALSTAAAVAGSGYTYTLTAFCLYGMAALALSLVACQAAGALRGTCRMAGRRLVAVNVLAGILCLAGVTAHVTLIDYYNTLGIQIYTWRPLESYYRQGFLTSFISSAQTIIPPKPKNYDADESQALLDEYAAAFDETEGASAERDAAVEQFDSEQPTVIAIMNETFSDLSIYQNMHCGYEGPAFFNGISDAVARGTLYVSAFGGGTCNTEFEFLTGNSMAYLGQGVYPYTIYNLTQTENLAQQFKDLGYTTTAMHPNHKTNWNRENVYRDFGFDQFLGIEDFQGAETLRNMVTDGATYDKILELLDQNSDPQFIFDVTMQNHSGYNTGLIPYEMRENRIIDGRYDSEINEYLDLIEESDRALEKFLGKLEDLDRKVVVVFFGDHQPSFPRDLNDAWFTGEDEAAHEERLWQTDYVIWANYDVAGSSQRSEVRDLSVNYLGAWMMELIGAPLTDYQKAQLTAVETMPAINTAGYQDANGTWYLAGRNSDEAADGGDGDDVERTRDELSRIQYLKLFDHGDGIFTKTFQSAANETDPNLDPGTTKIK